MKPTTKALIAGFRKNRQRGKATIRERASFAKQHRKLYGPREYTKSVLS